MCNGLSKVRPGRDDSNSTKAIAEIVNEKIESFHTVDAILLDLFVANAVIPCVAENMQLEAAPHCFGRTGSGSQ